jgi:hypothetical protein
VRAYSRPGCCLPTSATAYDVRALSTGLSFPRRDGGHDHLPFLTRHARPLANESGDARRAAQSSVRSGPGAGSSCLRRFARLRYRIDRPTSQRLRAGSSVGMDVHGSLDRVKDVSSSSEPLVGRLQAECVRFLFATLTTFPSSASRGHLLSPVRLSAWERAPCRRVGPTKTHVPPTAREGCRHPMDQGAFHRCGSGHVRGSLLSASRAGLPLTPPTRSPHGWGQSALTGIASIAVGQCPAGISREQVASSTSLGRFRVLRAWA